MNRLRMWIVGLMVLSLLGIGVVALAGNGFGNGSPNATAKQTASGNCALYERDADGDGIVNSEDPDWTQPLDGTGYGQGQGDGRSLSANRPLDGTGYGARQGGGQGQGGCSGTCTGNCL
jgi:hypothetical protein